MATIIPKKDRAGTVTRFKFQCCVGRDPLSGKQVWRTKSFPRPEGLDAKREKEKVELEAAKWEEAERTLYEKTHEKVDKRKISFSAFVWNHWWPLAIDNGEHTHTTLKAMRPAAKLAVDYFTNRGKTRLSAIDTEAVQGYVRWLKVEASGKKGNPYSPATQRLYYRVLNSIFEFARRMKYVDENPCNDVTVPKMESTNDIDYLKPEHAQRFIDCLAKQTLYWRTLVTMLLVLGLRRGEAAGLQWADLDEKTHVLTIQRNVTPDRDAETKINIGKPKSKKSRTVFVPPLLFDLLMAHKAEQMNTKGPLFPSAFIFSKAKDAYQPINPAQITGWLGKFTKKNGLPNLSPHDLRHTAATMAIESGCDIKSVSRLLGHSDAKMTLKFYAEATERAQATVTQNVENVLFNVKGKDAVSSGKA